MTSINHVCSWPWHLHPTHCLFYSTDATWVQLPPVPGQEVFDGSERPKICLHIDQHINLPLLQHRNVALLAVSDINRYWQVCWALVSSCQVTETGTKHELINNTKVSNLGQATSWVLLRVHCPQPFHLILPGDHILLAGACSCLGIVCSKVHPMPANTFARVPHMPKNIPQDTANVTLNIWVPCSTCPA